MVRFMKKMNGAPGASHGTARLSVVKEQAIKTVFFFTAFFAVIVVSFILLFLLRDGYVIFEKVGVLAFLTGTSWAPTAFIPLYGIFPLIAGTLLVTIGAMVFAVPLSIGCAIYISELASPRVKQVLKPVFPP
jgi:phosphate transport system permease protein